MPDGKVVSGHAINYAAIGAGFAASRLSSIQMDVMIPIWQAKRGGGGYGGYEYTFAQFGYDYYSDRH